MLGQLCIWTPLFSMTAHKVLDACYVSWMQEVGDRVETPADGCCLHL